MAQALQGLVANLLNRVLGMYVRNFDPSQLSISIWSGKVVLRDLELKKEALDQLHLPLNVVEGHLGTITLEIPWTNLRGKPVKVNVKDIFILAAPRQDEDFNEEEEEKRAQAIKMDKLESAELLKERNTEGMSQEEQQKQQGFVASLTTAIVDNLQISVENIHIRYEDSLSTPEHPFAVGLTLKDFTAVSTDSNWVAPSSGVVQNTGSSTHKLAKLGALAVYWDTGAPLIGTGMGADQGDKAKSLSHADVLSKFRELIVKENDDTVANHQFILKPVTGQAGIEMDKTGRTDRPKIRTRLFFDELGFVLDDEQYRDALMLVDLFHHFIRHKENKKYRPKTPLKEDPQAWLRFAGDVVLRRIHERNRQWTLDYIMERRRDRQRYINLFKKTKKEETLSAAETEKKSNLEKKYSYEDLRFWRSLARNQLRKENVGVVKKAPQKQSWGSWLWGGKKESHTEEQTEMTEEQRQELYNAIDFDEKKALSDAVDMPKDSVKMQAHLSLQTGSFTLKRDPHDKANEILKLLFDSFNVGLVQRPESMLAKLSLQGMRLTDNTTEGTLFPKILTVKGAPDLSADRPKDDLTDDQTVQRMMKQPDDDLEKVLREAFFSMSFEQNPLDGSADSAMTMTLKATEIVYNPTTVVEVVKFFKPPERHMESVNALLESAGETVEGLRKQTRAGLEFALEEHKTINAKIDLQAPVILIPDSVTSKDALCMIVDAGHVNVHSDLVDKETIQDIHAKQKQQYTEKDYEQLESLMYDKFHLKLQSTQVLIGPSVDAARTQLNADDDTLNYHLIDRINMDFLVETSIVPKSTDLTKFRISGSLPVLHASISDSKYKDLMHLIDVAVPKFEEEAATPNGVAKQPSGSRSKSSMTSAKPDQSLMRPRSKSFQFSAQEHELVMEDDDDHDQKAKFHDASKGTQEQTININQRNFEFKFVVEKLRGSLYRSDPDGKKRDQLLAELVAERFSLDFYQRAYDMTAEVGLGSLTLEDHVEEDPLPEFKNIVSSEEDNGSSARKDLFELKFVKVNPNSPEFQTQYEGIATNLDVKVSTINLIVTRKTLLTLMDFTLVTFTSSDAAELEADPESPLGEDESTKEEKDTKPSQDKIRIRAELKKIALVLNNDGIRLATLSLNTATVGLTLLGKQMRLGAKLGNFSLIDDVNQGAPVDSPLRQLVTIQGEELADFAYETFDPEAETYPGHDSAIKLRSGSIKINFLTEPFRKIMDFGVKFGKMQAIYNAARQAAAQQATQIQERANRIHFDVVVKTPIVVFPKMVFDASDQVERDLLTAYLGEIYVQNKFTPLDDKASSDTANEISAGIRNVRLTSLLHYSDDRNEEVELINKVDLDFNITYLEHRPGMKRPDLEARGSLSDINVKVSPQQLRLMLELSRTIPEAFATEPADDAEREVVQELPQSTTDAAKERMAEKNPDTEKSKTPSRLGPELGSDPDRWTKLDLVFGAPAVRLELLQAPKNEPIGQLDRAGLTKFSLNKTNIKLRMLSDGSMESELLIQSFTIMDTREKETNKFRTIMSLINNDITQQFMANISISGGDEQNLLAILSIDSPRILVSLDYVMALQGFLNDSFSSEDDSKTPQSTQDKINKSMGADDRTSNADGTVTKASQKPIGEDSTQSQSQKKGMSIAFRVNLVDAQAILLANPTIRSSEAVVLGLKQIIVAQQHATTLQVEKVGIFLCRMDKFDTSRLRILDDFSVTTSLDVRSQGEESTVTNIHVDIQPLVLRLSLRDILLVMQIVSKASELQKKDEEAVTTDNEPPERVKELQQKQAEDHVGNALAAKREARSQRTRQTRTVSSQSAPALESTVVKREEMDVHMGGIRVVLIGDQHELPFLDWSVKEFDVQINDWSASMRTDTTIETFINVYNFSKSAWEPLIEPWSLTFHMAKEADAGKMAMDLVSRKSLEVTVTTMTIAQLSKSFQFLNTEEDVLSKPRKSDSPYRMRNYTGFTLDVWAQSSEGAEGSAAKLEDGEEIPWRFEDPTTTRETLSPEGATGVIGMRLQGSDFDSVEKISVNREGETLYNLTPRKDKVLHRILVEVKLGEDNVKYITFRSPLLVENNTQLPIEIGVFSPEASSPIRIEKIAPGEARPSPVGAAFFHSLVVRPDPGFGYVWSNEKLYWKDLLRRPTQTITCLGEDRDSSPPFYFQMNSVFDKNDPLTNVYPYQRIKLSAPVELQNLLPYDFKYWIYDKNTKKDWSYFLRRGGVSPVHVVNLSHMLLLSVELQDTPFNKSEFGFINSNDRDFAREKALTVKDSAGLTLRLKLHYYNLPDSGGAFKVSVYSPYVLLNRSGLDLDVRSKAFLSGAKQAAGRRIGADPEHERGKAVPFMFSYSTDDPKNRALLKVGDSGWSKPQSFDAIGSNYEVKIPAAGGRSFYNVGVSVAQGEGKYNLTNVITVTPRFVLKNKLGEEINIREPGSTEVITLPEDKLVPLRALKQTENHQLSLCYPGLNNQWSAPFYITNVGRVHVKLAKGKNPQNLIKIEILIEGATIFLHLTYTQHWPFSMRNESDTEFYFYQANPNIEQDEEDRGSAWRPIRYKLPPRSIMPYAWDYPASRNKDLVLSVRGVERTVKLAEIGEQVPLKLPPAPGEVRSRRIDIDVVADGPKQTLVLANWTPELSLYKVKTGASTMTTQSTSTLGGFEVKEQDTEPTFKVLLRLTNIGISLINKKMKELLYVTFRDIELKYQESALYQQLNWNTKWIQIDNQLYGGVFPILLYPSVVPKTGKEMEAHPIFHLAVTRVKDDSYGVLYVKYFTFLLQQMTLEIDEDFIFSLLDFVNVPGASWSEETEGKLCDEELQIPEPSQEQSAQDIYFEMLHLQPMQLDLSFVRTEHVNAEDTMAVDSPFMFAVNVLTMSLGNVNDAPLRYNALMLENARISSAALITNIQNHYVQESLQQVHIVLGSADFLGNPVGLFKNVSSGVADIFYEPYQGLVMTDRPQDLGFSIAKGASSFVKKSVFGFSDSISKFTGSVSKGLAAATLDKDYQAQRRMSRSRNRPKHALYGITSGGNAFAASMASGIGGLARHPLEGAEKEGVAGFMKGVGKGFLGLATKPAIGAFDLASNLAEGVRNTTTVFDAEGLDRSRLTRFIGQDGIVRPYSQREALGQFWLKTLDDGKYFEESYIAHLELSEKELLVMLTYNGIMQVRTKNLKTDWDVPLRDVQRISKERTGINITLKEGRNGPFLPVQEESSRNWLYRQIAVAVNAYNQKWEVRG